MSSLEKSKNSARETVLIVDDDEENAHCFSAMIETAGYAAIVTTRGSESIDIIKREKVDLVIMDVVMPGIDGVTLAGRIKAMAGAADFLPVVLVTAYANEETKIAGLSCADAYIAKPVSNTELLAIVRSLLKIRRLTLELAVSENKYRRLYENFPQLCLSVKPDGAMVNGNRLFCETFQLSSSAVAGTSITSLLRPEDHPLVLRFLGSVVSTDPVPQQSVFEFKTAPAAGFRKFSVRAAVVDGKDDGGEIALALEDVTQKIDLEDERKVARKQLYRSAHLASIGTLASGLAHEINNPLTAILGFSSALLKRGNDHEAIDRQELASYLKIIHDETIRCRDIVDHLHRFAQESGEARISSVSIFECIVNALRLVNMRAMRSDITILNEIREDFRVQADANKLEQVFINVLTNCIDFCGPGTTVAIAKAVEKRPSKHAVVTVRDNGPGMTAEVLAKAFDPFFTTKEVGKGIGMGLAISHRILEELNGRIDLASEAGKGTTVRIEIPYHPEVVSIRTTHE
jgi:PAS domain S-box-containing protein